MFGMLDISTSALVAQRTRLDAIAANLANADVKVDPNSPNAFSERVVEFATGDPESGDPMGVHVAAITPRKAFRSVQAPNDPSHDANGNVWYPNIDPVTQQANAMVASRAYDANLAAIDATKAMFDAALRIIA
ncbi:MAG: flagellar basal body rod C-terminal domain-containing protein [Planctomycetota bacterium]|jgi:flagellar basal-body rod protein FlgC